MNPQRLLALYERIADAPDAIARLRRFILDLAVRGKLVPQDSRDEPARELVKRIAAEKKRLDIVAAKRTLDCGGRLPIGWVSVTLSDYAIDIFTGPFGSALHQSDYVVGGIPLVNPSHMIDDQIIPDERVSVTAETMQRLASYRLKSGDIVMARRGEVGRAALVSEHQEGWLCGTGSFFLRFSAEVNRPFLLLVLRSSDLRSYLVGQAVGTTMVNLNHAILKAAPLAVPPFAEQHRIVAKVDELMALCDRLEVARATREATRDRLAAASLGHLNAPDPDTFRDDACFALDALPALTTRADQIKQLRQTILNLAVRGKLVPQDPNDAPAPILHDQVDHGADGRLNIQIPANWRWARVADVASARLGKMLDKAKDKGRAYRYLRNTNVHWFEIRVYDLKTMPLEDSDFAAYRLEPGDVLICEGGHGIGRTAVWRATESDIVFQKALHRVRPGPHLNSEYFTYCCFVYFDAGVMQGYFTGVGIPHFTGKALAQLAFPLPPLAEQKRIVTKVDELMALCDQLEESLTACENDRRRLLDALLAEALAPSADAVPADPFKVAAHA